MIEIEEQFFKTFEIEQKCPNYKADEQWCQECVLDYLIGDNCNYDAKYFPEITSEILLKLILILMNSKVNVNIQKEEKPITLNDFKYCLLKACIKCADCIEDKVKSLFEGEGEE